MIYGNGKDAAVIETMVDMLSVSDTTVLYWTDVFEKPPDVERLEQSPYASLHHRYQPSLVTILSYKELSGFTAKV